MQEQLILRVCALAFTRCIAGQEAMLVSVHLRRVCFGDSAPALFCWRRVLLFLCSAVIASMRLENSAEAAEPVRHRNRLTILHAAQESAIRVDNTFHINQVPT